jgi:hypothetical protein
LKARGLQEASIGLTILQAIRELGIEPSELMTALRLFRRLKQADTLPERFLESAKHLMELEQTMHLSYEKLVEEFRVITEKVERLRSEEKRGNAELGELRENEKQELERVRLTRQDLASYKNDKQALESVSLTIKDLNSTAEFIRGTKTQTLLDAAKELARLKSTTGKSYQQMMDEHRQKSANLERLKTQTEELEQKRQTVTGQCAKVETQLESELRQAKVTGEQLARYIETRQQLAGYGLQIEQIQNLPMVVWNLKAAGYDHRKIMVHLGRVESLQTQTEEAKSTLESLQFQINAEKLELGRTRQQTTAAKKQLERLNETTKTRLLTLKELERKEATSSAKIVFAETLTSLILDPSIVPDTHIQAATNHLNRIQTARAHAGGLPIDYNRLREEMVMLVEVVLGKALVLKDTYVRGTRNLADRNTELLLDRVGRLAEKRRQLDSKELDLDSKSRALEEKSKTLENANWQQLTHAALSEVAEGNIKILQCKRCNAVLAYHAKSECWSSFCLFCSIGHLETATDSLTNHWTLSFDSTVER